MFSAMLALMFFSPMPLKAQINLTITKSNNAPNPVPSGQPFTYTITYSWSGGAPGTLYIVDNVPAALDVLSTLPGAPVATISGNQVTFVLTGLTMSSGSGTVQINARFKPGVTCGGVQACNRAGISTQPDGEFVYSNSNCVISAEPVNRWTLVKELIAGCAVDDEIIFRIRISAPSGNNIGGVNLNVQSLIDILPPNAQLMSVTVSWNSFSGSNPYTLNGPSTLYVNSYPVWYIGYVKVKYPSGYFSSGQTVANIVNFTFTTPCDNQPQTWSDTATVELCDGVSQGNISKWLALNMYFPNNPVWSPVWTPGCCGTYRLYYHNTGTLAQPGFVMEDDIPGEVDVNTIKTNVPAGNLPVTVDVYCWSGGVCSATPCTTVTYNSAGLKTLSGLPPNVCKVKWTYSGSIAVNQYLSNYIDVCVRSTNFMNGNPVTVGQNVTNTMSVSANNLSQLTVNHTKVIDSTQPKVVATKLFVGGCNPPCSINPNGPFQPGDTVRFRMAVANIGNADALNCTITDNLPSGLSYVGNETYYFGSYNYMLNMYNPPCCSLTTTVPSQIGGSINTPSPGDTNLTWTFPVLPGSCDGSVDYFIIEFDVVISSDPPALPGQYQNTFDINGSNFNNVTSNVAYLTVNQTAQLQAKKEVRRINADGTSTAWASSATVPVGNTGEYLITVKNTGNTPLSNLCVLDIMPWVGDINVLPPYNPRNSAFDLPYNPTSGALTVTPSGFQDYYNSLSLIQTKNPTRSTECGGFCGVSDPSGAVTGTFNTSAAQTYSLKVSANTGVNLAPGGVLNVVIPFTVPQQAQPQMSACNSFGVQAEPSGMPNVCLSVESNNACVVAAEPEPCIEYGEYRMECVGFDSTGQSIFNFNFTITNTTGISTSLMITPSNGTIINYSPTSIPNNVPTTVSGTFITSDTTGVACFQIILISGNDKPVCDTTICFDYKLCEDPCPCPFDIRIDKQQASQASGNQVFVGNLFSVSGSVLQVRATVVSATVTQFCWWGGSSSYTTSGTFVSANTPPLQTQGIGTSELTFTDFTCPQVMNQPFNFYLNIPNAPSKWCYQKVKVCIRYTITDCKCNTCDTLVCYEFNRKWMPIIITHPDIVIGKKRKITKDDEDQAQLSDKPFLEMTMESKTRGTLSVNNPAEDEYTAAMTIYAVSIKAAPGISVKSVTPSLRSWNSGVPTNKGMTATGILQPGNSIDFTVEFENQAMFKQWLNDITIDYMVENVPDTLSGTLQIKSRAPGAENGDMFTQDFDNSATSARAKTFALRFDAYNLSSDSIAKVILRVKQGMIIAVGPQLNQGDAVLSGYYAANGQWRLLSATPDENLAMMTPIPPGMSIQPVFITIVNDDEQKAEIEFETYTSDDDLVSKGTVTIETPVTGVEGNGIIDAVISLSEAIPNPARNSVLIKFKLMNDEPHLSLTVTDARGAVVKTLLSNASYSAGEHEIIFDTSKLTNGVYYYTLTTSSSTQTRRVVIMK